MASNSLLLELDHATDALIARHHAPPPNAAAEIAPLITSLITLPAATRLLVMPSVVPLGTTIALDSRIPMVYPSPIEPGVIEGAYDTYVSTVLLTDVLYDATEELALARRVKGLGLEVKAIVSVIDLGIADTRGDKFPYAFYSLTALPDLLSKIPALSPSMRAAVESWIKAQHELISTIP